MRPGLPSTTAGGPTALFSISVSVFIAEGGSGIGIPIITRAISLDVVVALTETLTGSLKAALDGVAHCYIGQHLTLMSGILGRLLTFTTIVALDLRPVLLLRAVTAKVSD